VTTERPDAPKPITEISPRDLADRLSRGEPVGLLDVREPFERELCAIVAGPGVHDLHVPMGLVSQAIDSIKALARSVPVVVYCHHGVRSRRVAQWLTERGVPGLSNLDGGIDAWSADVDPAVRRY